MSDNGNAPAYPQPAGPAGFRQKWSDGFGGLSKREYMAAEAMKGLLANTLVFEAAAKVEKEGDKGLSAVQVIAVSACTQADALLEALEK